MNQNNKTDKIEIISFPNSYNMIRLLFLGTLATIFLMLHPVQLNGQTTMVLSLDSAINHALTHNRTLINSKFAIDKSVVKIRETIATGLPQVNASLDYSNFLGAQAELQLNPLAPPAIIEFNPTSNFKANVSQLVFSGSYYVGIQLSKLASDITQQSYQKDELNVKEQTIQAYYMILATERILKIVKENRANVLTIYEKTSNMAKAGLLEETDAKKIKLLLSQVDNTIKSTERQVEMGYNLMRLHLGLESNQSIKLTASLDELADRVIAGSISATSFDIANNIDFQLIQSQELMAEKQIMLKKASYLPSLAAFYSYTQKLKEPAFDMTPNNVLGLTLNIPIFAGGLRQSQLNQAKIDYYSIENTKELVNQQINLQKNQFEFTYNNLLDQFLTQKENLSISKEVLDKMNLKFAQGIISTLELTSANNDYLTAEINYTNIVLQLLNAEISLRKINSKL